MVVIPITDVYLCTLPDTLSLSALLKHSFPPHSLVDTLHLHCYSLILSTVVNNFYFFFELILSRFSISSHDCLNHFSRCNAFACLPVCYTSARIYYMYIFFFLIAACLHTCLFFHFFQLIYWNLSFCSHYMHVLYYHLLTINTQV